MKSLLANAWRKVAGFAVIGAVALHSVSPAFAQLTMDTVTADVETVNEGMLVVAAIIMVVALLAALIMASYGKFAAGAATVVMAVIISGLIYQVSA